MTSDHDTTTPLKRCTKCGFEFPATLEHFGSHKLGKNGLRAQCKECRRLYGAANAESIAVRQREYRAANPELFAGRAREYAAANPKRIAEYRAANAEHIAEYQRKYAAANAEHIAEYQREYRAANSQRIAEQRREYNRAYLQTDAGKAVMRAAWHRRRARELAAGGTHNAADIATIRAGQTDKRGLLHCWWCACVIEGNAYHVDHRVPLAKGGRNDAGNLCLACPHCNQSKHAKLPSDWNGRLL